MKLASPQARPRRPARRGLARPHARDRRLRRRADPAGGARRLGAPRRRASPTWREQLEHRLGAVLPLPRARLRLAAAARLPMGRRLGLCEPRRARPQGARRRDAGIVLDRSADVPGRLRRRSSARAIRSRWRTRRWGIDFEAEVAVDHRRCADGRRPRGGRGGDPARHARQRRLACATSSRPSWRRASASSSRSRRRPSRRSRSRRTSSATPGTARKLSLPLLSTSTASPSASPNAGVDMTFDFPTPDRACRKDAAARRRHDHRLRHGVEQGPGRRARAPDRRGRPRLFLHRRAAHRRDHPRRQAERRRSCTSATACASR